MAICKDRVVFSTTEDMHTLNYTAWADMFQAL